MLINLFLNKFGVYLLFMLIIAIAVTMMYYSATATGAMYRKEKDYNEVRKFRRLLLAMIIIVVIIIILLKRGI